MGYLLHVWGQRVDLPAVLVGDDVTVGGPGVSAQDHAVLENDATNGGSGLCNLIKSIVIS